MLEIDPNARAIVSSGYSNDPVMANFRDYGFLGMVPKPYGIRDMLDEVRRVAVMKSENIKASTPRLSMETDSEASI